MTLLKHCASLLPSNVDKKSRPDEQAVRLCNYTDVYYGDALSAEIGDYMAATATAEQIVNLRLRQGDTVLTKDSETPSDIGRSAYIFTTAPDFVCGYHLTIVRPDEGVVHPKYLTWALRTSATREYLAAAATGVTRYGLRTEALASTPVDLPPLGEQRRIADFLDDQVTLLDRAIDLRGRQARLLRARFVTERHEVTSRLWESHGFIPLRYLVTCLDGRRVPLNRAERSLRPGTIPYWGAGSIVDFVDEALFDETLVLLGEDGAPFFDDDRDVAFLSQGPAWINNHIHALRPHRGVDAGFLVHALNAVDYSRHISGATRDKLTQEDMKALPIPAAPLAEQSTATRALTNEGERLVAGTSLLQRSVGLLRERKQALITAAVTGEFDVSTAGRVAR